MEHILQHGTDNVVINLVKCGEFLDYVVTCSRKILLHEYMEVVN
jgi:hypothetical protein